MFNFSFSTSFVILGLILSSISFGQRPADLERIHKRGELVVGLNAEDTPPFVFANARGALTGIDVELLRLAARELGVRLRLVRTAKNFDELTQQVASGKVDVGASALFPTLSRSEYVLFTDPYWYAVPVTLVNRVEKARRRPRKMVGSAFLDEPGVRLGVFDSAGSSITARALFPRATLVLFKTRNEMRPALLRGDLTAVYIDEIEELKWREQMANLDLFLAVERDETRKRDLSLAVGAKDTQLWHWLNRFIRIQDQTGVLKKLHHQFFEEIP